MPNIEIHAHMNDISGLRVRMGEKIREVQMGKEVIITAINSHPYGCDGSMIAAPFLRILGENKEEIERVVRILKEMEITKLFDIETVLLSSFIPKEEL